MSSFYCVKCGLEAHGKCCHCRSIYAAHPDKTVTMIEQVMSYRLLLDDPTKLKFKLYKDETWADGLIHLRDLLKDQPDDVVRIFACTHEWDFKPFAKSEIECGHRSEEKPLLDYLSDAWCHLTEGTTYSPAGVHCSICNKHEQWCEHILAPTMQYARDENDVQAAAIIEAAHKAAGEGVDWDYRTWNK